MINKINKIKGHSISAIYRRLLYKFRFLGIINLEVPKHTISKVFDNERLLIAITFGMGDVILAASVVPTIKKLNKHIKFIDLLIPEYHKALLPLLEQVFDEITIIHERDYIGRSPLPYELLRISKKYYWQERYISHYTNEPNELKCKNFFEVICDRYNLSNNTTPIFLDVPKKWILDKKKQVLINMTANSINYENSWSNVLEVLDNSFNKEIKFVINTNRENIDSVRSTIQRDFEIFSGTFEDLLVQALSSQYVLGTRSGLNDVLAVLGYSNQVIFYPTNTYSDYYKLGEMKFDLSGLIEINFENIEKEKSIFLNL